MNANAQFAKGLDSGAPLLLESAGRATSERSSNLAAAPPSASAASRPSGASHPTAEAVASRTSSLNVEASAAADRQSSASSLQSTPARKPSHQTVQGNPRRSKVKPECPFCVAGEPLILSLGAPVRHSTPAGMQDCLAVRARTHKQRLELYVAVQRHLYGDDARLLPCANSKPEVPR